MPKPEGNTVDHPHHYADSSGVECIEVVEHLGFCLGNAIKYVWRCDEKFAPLDDLKKALWYVAYEHARKSQDVRTENPVDRSDPRPVAAFFAKTKPGFRREAIRTLWNAEWRARGYNALSMLSQAKRMLEKEIAQREGRSAGPGM
jgi:hypothetical protein